MDVDIDLARVDGWVPEQLLLDVLLERCVGFHVGLQSGHDGHRSSHRPRAASDQASPASTRAG
ncbi:hypothetical protein [Burkholderia ubonensis]|uniref:hypothetical protein n=1 Tax=Burkholderia ubonensis TaxID=101571 RepID=UPI0018DF6B0A|nr:hypothetical protein [Burkholderia ubonensis]